VYAVRFGGVRAFVALLPRLRSEGRISLPHAEGEAAVGDVARLRMTLPGHNVFEAWARIAMIEARSIELRVGLDDEGVRKALVHPETIAARARLAAEGPGEADEVAVTRLSEQVPDDDDEKMPLRRRISRMGMEDKINLALSGNREERMALAMDSNKAIHHYLLKNAKLTLDELAFMARLPSLNPDVLDKIAENPAYTQNPAVTRALVNNPRTPVKTSIRLLDRLPRSEVMNLAKRTGMNARLVMAAKKKLEGGGR
jgi:hypothetical protein